MSTGGAPPGWYHAEGDPPGTERYWNGTEWTEGPRPVQQTPPASSIPPIEPLSGEAPSAESPGSGSPTDMPILGGTDASTPTLPGATPDVPSTPGSSSDLPTMPGEATPPPTSMPVFGSTGASPAGGPPSFPGAPAGAMPGAAPGYGYAENSQATTGLVLSIVGLICCLTAPIGLYLGWAEKNAIDAGRRDPKNRGQAVAAMVIGILGCVILGLFLVLFMIGAVAA